ncbi:uncharacterized protein [Marmota flaviventris]|uniref:uncharacterized protein isoform X2 n=1 Tax=Marmota flaviventris TaxID=93162 RepID=UPI003A84F6D0
MGLGQARGALSPALPWPAGVRWEASKPSTTQVRPCRLGSRSLGAQERSSRPSLHSPCLQPVRRTQENPWAHSCSTAGPSRTGAWPYPQVIIAVPPGGLARGPCRGQLSCQFQGENSEVLKMTVTRELWAAESASWLWLGVLEGPGARSILQGLHRRMLETGASRDESRPSIGLRVGAPGPPGPSRGRVVQCLVPMLSLWTAATTPGSSCVKAPTLSLLLTFWGRGHPWPGSLPVSLLGGRCCRAGSGPGVAASADGPGLYVSRGQRRDQPCTELGLLTKQPGSDRAFSSAHIEEPRRTATAGKAYSPATSCFGDPEPLGPLWSP